MWFKQKEKEKFVEGIVDDIMHDSSLGYEHRYKLKNMGVNEIKSKVYKIFNAKVRVPYPMNRRALYSEKLKNEIKREFFETLGKGY